jgi:acyl carrier protein
MSVDVEDVVRRAVTEHECRADFTLQTTWEELGANSLDVVQILVLIENELGKEINERSLYEIKTVGDLVKVVEGYCR